MALLGNFDDSYTQTGKGTLTRWANGFSLLPVVRNIPILGSTVTGILGYADTLIESAQWLLRGKLGSAATVAAAGIVSTTVNTISDSSLFWWANAASGATTGATLGTHARAVTESVIGSVTGALGAKPTVLSAYPAGIGSISAGVEQNGPGKFTSQVSAQRGQDADEAYSRYLRGEGGVHVNELQSANGRGA